MVATTDITAGGAAVPVRRGLMAAVCCAGLALTGLDATIINAALPTAGRALGGGTAGQQWIVAGYAVPLAAGLLLAGGLADRIGRRAVLICAFALFAAGSWGCSLAPGLGWLVAGRAVQGCGAAGLAPAGLGIIAAAYPSGRARARVIGAFDASLGIGMAGGPLLGGLLVQAAGWRAVYWATVPVALAGVVLVALVVPEVRAAAWRPPDLAGQALACAAMGAVVLAIIEGPAAGWGSGTVLAAVAVAAAAGAGLAAVERRRAFPVIDGRLLRSRPVAAGLAAGLLLTAAMSAFWFLMTLYLQDARGLGPERAGLVLVAMPAAMTAASAASGRLVTRSGPRPLLAAGGAAVAVACVLLHGTAAGPAVAAACGLFGAGIGLGSAPVTAIVMRGAPADLSALASALNSAARQLGAALGVAVAGSVLAAAGGGASVAPAAWWVVAACGTGVAAAGLVLDRRGLADCGAGGSSRGQRRGP